jgi:hypothetical protein
LKHKIYMRKKAYRRARRKACKPTKYAKTAKSNWNKHQQNGSHQGKTLPSRQKKTVISAGQIKHATRVKATKTVPRAVQQVKSPTVQKEQIKTDLGRFLSHPPTTADCRSREPHLPCTSLNLIPPEIIPYRTATHPPEGRRINLSRAGLNPARKKKRPWLF